MTDDATPADEGILLGDETLPGFSEKMLADAAEDARIVMVESPIIAKLLACDIVARHLFLLVRSGIETELSTGWEIDNVELVIQTLGRSAEADAVDNFKSARDIQRDILEGVLPIVDIFVQMQDEIEAKERQNGETETDDQTEILSGDNSGNEDGVGEVLRSPGGLEEHQRPGEDSGRHQEEDGDAGS